MCCLAAGNKFMVMVWVIGQGCVRVVVVVTVDGCVGFKAESSWPGSCL